MTATWRAALAGLLILVCGPAVAETYRDRTVEMVPVAELDLDRYLGKSYEIARFPNRFEKRCEGVTAEYALRADGQAKVVGPGKLSVTFVPWLPFARGDYWVLYLDADYTLAVVGAPRGTTGWILARTPSISPEARSMAEKALVRNGYDPSRLKDVRH